MFHAVQARSVETLAALADGGVDVAGAENPAGTVTAMDFFLGLPRDLVGGLTDAPAASGSQDSAPKPPRHVLLRALVEVCAEVVVVCVRVFLSCVL